MHILKMEDVDLCGRRVLIRCDLNVPIESGKIISDVRILSSLPSIEYAMKKSGHVMIMSHLGRPKEGKYDKNFSLKPIAEYLKKQFPFPVRLEKNYLTKKIKFSEKKELVVLENVRFNMGEKKNDEVLSKKYAELCDVFIMDAFGSSHRMHSSTYGIIKFAPISCSGSLFHNEIKQLQSILEQPEHPMVSIVGGSKISTKMKILDILSKISDWLIVGGGIANTLLSARGFNIGKSLFEIEYVQRSKDLLNNRNILLPIDVSVSSEFSEDSFPIQKTVKEIKENEKILDLGSNSIERITNLIQSAKTVLWNGPIGAFELSGFCIGTKSIVNAISNSSAFSVVGGGDTISAIEKFGNLNKIDYVSTGGGAFLEFIRNKTLPSILALQKKRG